MRNPMKSYDRADSERKYYGADSAKGVFKLGEKDYNLAKQLCKSGSEHRKWMRQVTVWVEINAPRYWWSEFDTYRIGVSANSESTMHKLKDENLALTDFDFDWGTSYIADKAMQNLVESLRDVRDMMNEADSKDKDKYLRVLKQLLPESFRQKRTVCLNYEVLHSMYHQRKKHRLHEWSDTFCNWVRTLPYSEFITEEFEQS